MKTHIAVLLFSFLITVRAETFLLTGGTNHTLTVPVGKTAYFTGSFGRSDSGDDAVEATVQIGSTAYEGVVIGFEDVGTKLRVIAGPATLTFNGYSNAVISYRFVTGVLSLTLPPQHFQTLTVPAGRTLKTVGSFNDGGNGYPLRLRITKNGNTVETKYPDSRNNELTGPLTIQVLNDSPSKTASFAYSLLRPVSRLP